MTSTSQMIRPLGGRAFVLLVLAVLTGLVAMHGLGPAGAALPERSVSTAVSPVVADPHHQLTEGCQHAAGGDHGRHVEHADGTCAASSISTAPALPALTPAGFEVFSAVAPSGWPTSVTASGRAPPTLSELQLLRI
ncbi:DUF6153 family protein [Streptomyces sp. NPDC004647]|uniref:DUF6153 family protein n=1 Tax=Streptomyces sp. NPDC004647 TaxID=3154671 RepID=UPI0033B4E073